MYYDIASVPVKDSEVSGILSSFPSYRRTLGAAVSCRGIGIHGGKPVNLRLLPAASGDGVIFRRSDIGGAEADIAARYDNVFETRRCTRIRNAAGVSVSTVEHICAALAAMGVSDVIVELDGEEVPIMDGSCRDFIAMIERAGVYDFAASRQFLRVLRAVEIRRDFGSCRLDVSDESQFSFTLDYGDLGRQFYDFSLSGGDFIDEISAARTFGLYSELESLQADGYALGASMENTIALGEGGVMNEGGLRYSDELVRHKILDAIGDLSLSGYVILGHFRGDRSGHCLNNELLRELFSDPDNFQIFS